MAKIGIMLTSVKLLGTQLELKAGQKVILCPALNLPRSKSPKRYYARPPRGEWGDGLHRSCDDSILVTDQEVKIVRND